MYGYTYDVVDQLTGYNVYHTLYTSSVALLSEYSCDASG